MLQSWKHDSSCMFMIVQATLMNKHMPEEDESRYNGYVLVPERWSMLSSWMRGQTPDS